MKNLAKKLNQNINAMQYMYVMYVYTDLFFSPEIYADFYIWLEFGSFCFKKNCLDNCKPVQECNTRFFL